MNEVMFWKEGGWVEVRAPRGLKLLRIEEYGKILGKA